MGEDRIMFARPGFLMLLLNEIEAYNGDWGRYPANRGPSILGTTTATAIQKRHLKSKFALLQT